MLIKQTWYYIRMYKGGEPTFCICFITKGHNFRPDLEKGLSFFMSIGEVSPKLVNY